LLPHPAPSVLFIHSEIALQGELEGASEVVVFCHGVFLFTQYQY